MRLHMAPKPADSTSGRHPDEAQAKVKAACEACRTRKIKVFILSFMLATTPSTASED